MKKINVILLFAGLLFAQSGLYPQNVSNNKPDLVIAEIGSPNYISEKNANGTSVTVTVVNTGSACGAFTVVFETFEPYFILKNQVPGLKKEEKITITFTIKDHWVLDDGKCELKACVDPENKIEESNEKNNCRQSSHFG